MGSPSVSNSTCWMLIRGAAAGSGADRAEFARRYISVVRAYLTHRWRSSRLVSEVDDAVQEVFLECFRKDGVLDRMRESEPGSFRAFLYGVARNVALRTERGIGTKREVTGREALAAEGVPGDEPTLSRVFDRAWAQAVFRQAGELQESRAALAGERALRRVELLRRRSRDNLPIREIARIWNEDAALVHKEYARARSEFKSALTEVVAANYPGATDSEIDERCRELIDLLRA